MNFWDIPVFGLPVGEFLVYAGFVLMIVVVFLRLLIDGEI